MTGSDVATRNGGTPAYAQAALAIEPGQVTWKEVQLAALAQLGVKDASPGDQAVFLHMCQRTGLDPFSKQIMMIGRKENQREKHGSQWTDNWTVKWTIQTGIEGWRVIRDRAERRNGCRGIKGRFIYYDTDGNEHKVWTRQLPPVVVEMTYTLVEPDGREVPYTSQLRFAEYCQFKKLDNGERVAIAQWAPDQKPVHMLEKCVEADAYRCAFPQDFAGLMLDDAMPPPDDIPAAPPARATGQEIRERPRRPVQAKAEVLRPPADDAPWPGDAAPAPAPDEAGPRDAVIAELDRLKIVAYAAQGDVLTRLAGRAVSDTGQLTAAEASAYAASLARCTTRAQLDAMLKDGTVPGE